MRYVLQAVVFYLYLGVSIALGQTLPDYSSTTVNDFADLLPAPAEAELRAKLASLKRDTGIEMTVVTLPSQSPYAPTMTLEQFATALFDHWGVGDAQRNDGIMVLVLRDDRAMRIELGMGFAQDWNGHAARIVKRDFLPRFRDDQYALGIMNGSDAVIDDIARPFSAGADRPPKDIGSYIVIGVLGLFTATFVGFRSILDLGTRLRTCPQCGTKGTLRVTRRTTMRATRMTPGQKEKVTYCTNCDYKTVACWKTARLSSKSSSSRGGSFGGGRSGGGGASGRW
ncbi:YgcG family protein [uncultured Tateyamaria sp.]|uniref:TPM domain-containing protein n=1 Tax=Tateyamaria sp. 1078 TaxID=3417464 RepID=UPI00261E39DB|nr:TPM domain-containing protein [uncultured Tateyamaria sp.]